jgi:hypothetical protein
MHKIDINLRVSVQFNVLIAAVALLSVVIILTLPISMMIKVFLLLFAAIYSISIYLQHGLPSMIALKLTNEGWFLRESIGDIAVDLLGESTITAFVCVLRFKAAGISKKRTCVVFNDALNRDDYRRLIVQLRASAAYKAERIRRRPSLSVAKIENA